MKKNKQNIKSNIITILLINLFSAGLFSQENLNVEDNCRVNLNNLGLFSFELNSSLDSILPKIVKYQKFQCENEKILIEFNTNIFFIESEKDVRYQLIFKEKKLIKYYFEIYINQEIFKRFLDIITQLNSNIIIDNKNEIKYFYSYNTDDCSFYFILVPEFPYKAKLHFSFESFE